MSVSCVRSGFLAGLLQPSQVTRDRHKLCNRTSEALCRCTAVCPGAVPCVWQVLAGLLDEAAMLLHQGLKPGSNMATSAVGYRQAMNWLLTVRAPR
jgi:hypothetical protein